MLQENEMKKNKIIIALSIVVKMAMKVPADRRLYTGEKVDMVSVKRATSFVVLPASDADENRRQCTDTLVTGRAH